MIPHAPQLLPTSLTVPFVLLVGTGFAMYLFYRFVYRVMGKLITAFAIATLVGVGYGTIRLHSVIANWQKAVSKKPLISPTHVTSGTLDASSMLSSLNSSPTNYAVMTPLAHQNAWMIAIVAVVGVLWVLGFLFYRSLSPLKRAEWARRFASSSTYSPKRKSKSNMEYPIHAVELAIRKDDGKPIIVGGKDRFLNTLILGSIGTGKTSRIMLKAIYQDLRAIRDGWFHDVIVLDPDGEFAQKVVDFAKRLGITQIEVIDLAGKLDGTMSFNPFLGGDIADIIDNVRAALQEQMGNQDPFFQKAQDDLVRTVIMVLVPLWPDTDFLQFADLVTDPIHFRAICNMITDAATGKTVKMTDKKGETDELEAVFAIEKQDVTLRFKTLNINDQRMVLSAARSFLQDTRSEQKLEKLESITKGLKIVVGELANNPRLRQVFGTKDLPAFDFKSFLATGKEKKGRLLVVTTGNRPAGLLFGKLFLVTLKMYSLERQGKEDTRRPVYLYVDEFPVFGTESFTQMYSQARKYRVGMMFAMQARSQLDDVSKKFLDVVEGNSRNKVFFGAPSPEDAKFLEKALGTVTELRTTHSENKLSWFGFDNRNIDRKVSTVEVDESRFRLEDIMYGLAEDEAIFAITVNNHAEVPCVGLTSWADQWVEKQRGFFRFSEPYEEPFIDVEAVTISDREDIETIPKVKSSEIIRLRPELPEANNRAPTPLADPSEGNPSTSDLVVVDPALNEHPMEVTRTDLRMRKKESIPSMSTVVEAKTDTYEHPPTDPSAPTCMDCSQDMELFRKDDFDTYIRYIYRCTHHERPKRSVQMFCRTCGQEVQIEETVEENQLICPKCGVISRRKKKIG